MRPFISVICGTGLFLSAALMWWGKTSHASSLVRASASRKIQSVFRRPIGVSKDLETTQPDARLVGCSTPEHIVNDETEDLLASVQRLFSTGNPSDRDLVYTNLLPALVRMNPVVAAHFAEDMKSDLFRAEILRTVAQTWASLDPESAVKWAGQLQNSDEQTLELSYVCNELSVKDPARAAQIVNQWTLGEHKEAVLQNIAQQWAAQNFDDAKTWAIAEPASELRNVLLARIACVRSTTAPMEAVQLIADQIPDSPIQTEALMSVIYQWGTRDLPGAIAWVNLLPSGPLRERADRQLSTIASSQEAAPEAQN